MTKLNFLFIAILSFSPLVYADEHDASVEDAISDEGAPAESSEADAAAQANNPLANLVAFNVQSYYIGELTEIDDNANQFWLRYAQPLSIGDSDWLLRASLPLNTFPGPGGGHDTGLGDFNVFNAYLFDTKDPAVSFGLGPQITAPTATQDLLGSEKWSAGLANVLFDARNPKFQWGYLLTWQHSFAGESDRAPVNIGALQPFWFYQLGQGWYTGSAPIMVYNFENNNYSIPLGLRLGKVTKKNKTVFNFFVEPQYSVADGGAGLPEWQIYIALNMQFWN